MAERPSYAHQVRAKAHSETKRFVTHKLLTGACVAITGIILRLSLWHFQQITTTWAELWTNLVIVVGSFLIVMLGSFIVNLFRAPALLDQGRADEIADLTGKLKLVESSQAQNEIKLRLATLMERYVEIRERLERIQNDAELTELVDESDDWVRDTIAVLKDSGEFTDAVAFSQVGKLPQSAEQVQEWRHIPDEPRRRQLIRLAMYRKKLDQIRDSRRL
jgi:hypothetical protein